MTTDNEQTQATARDEVAELYAQLAVTRGQLCALLVAYEKLGVFATLFREFVFSELSATLNPFDFITQESTRRAREEMKAKITAAISASDAAWKNYEKVTK